LSSSFSSQKFSRTKEKLDLKKATRARHQWLTPVILAIWDAEIRRIAV
jgi:hypothetical protein